MDKAEKSREHMLKIADKQIQLEQLGLLVGKKEAGRKSLKSSFDRVKNAHKNSSQKWWWNR